MTTDALEYAKNWAKNPYFDEADRKEIQDLIEKNDTKEIEERFYKDLEFGTGGMRSIIAMGRNRINKYTIRKATQALAQAIKKSASGDLKVAISYDSRKFSDKFARETASVLAGNGIKAYIYQRLNPVALLSFSTRYHKANAGVMVTASHNPPNNNGYKVFWSDGAQVTPPNDKNIINEYNALGDFNKISYMNFEEGVEKGLINWVGEDVEDAYFESVKTAYINPKLCKEKGKELKIIYTPIHGTGLVPCTRILNELGLTNYEVVKEQAEPDSAFPTVSSPNPENPEALALAVKLLKEKNGDLAVGTDPDTDRLGVVVNDKRGLYYLNGNQLGVLFINYIFKNLKEQGKMPEHPYFVKTVVTTELQKVIADHYGVETFNTLTGFKWICGKVAELEKTNPEKTFMFGTEESFGYLNHGYIRDKDGVAPFGLLGEMALWYKLKGMTLVDALDEIYDQFGFYQEALLSKNYYGIEGAEKIERIMDRFRKNTPTEIVGEKVVKVEDYEQSFIKDFTNDKTISIEDIPKSNVLGFTFDSGNKLYLRPSGTEPKIKFYIMNKVDEGDLKTKKANAQKRINEVLNYLEAECEKA